MSDSKEPSQPFIERLEARAYSRATEVPERVKIAILNIFPESTRKDVRISESTTKSHVGTPIRILNGTLTRKRETLPAAEWIFSKLSEGSLRHIAKSLELRIDEECTFFLRIDKQAAYLEEIELAMGADVIRLQIHIRNWPRCTVSEAEELITRLISLTGVFDR